MRVKLLERASKNETARPCLHFHPPTPQKKINHANILKDYGGSSVSIFQNIMRNFLSALSTATDELID